jgi:hypothetical protein
MKELPEEEAELSLDLLPDPHPPADRQSPWFWLQEAPFEAEDENDHTQEALSVEFRRVKSLREEQETKIAMFLREDKGRGRAEHMQNESPTAKYSQSLSPRKTKKIDKTKPLKLTQETC